MPELPEVETTATILNTLVKGKTIISVWTDYDSPYYKGKDNIKNPKYFKKFTEEVSHKKIIRVYRRAKNVLIDTQGNQTILVHMKMTGQLLYGKYKQVDSGKWIVDSEKDSPLKNPSSRFIHLVFSLNNGNHVAFSDMRKFGTITLISDKLAFEKYFNALGPEPLEDSFDLKQLTSRLNLKPSGKIKTVLMNPEVVVGIGNIYSDEVLWASNIHPERTVKSLKKPELEKILLHTKRLLKKGIDFGGDSMSDYRNPYGEKGSFQEQHEAYRRTSLPCRQKNCKGKIVRKVIGGRSAHFCNTHQKKL